MSTFFRATAGLRRSQVRLKHFLQAIQVTYHDCGGLDVSNVVAEVLRWVRLSIAESREILGLAERAHRPC